MRILIAVAFAAAIVAFATLGHALTHTSNVRHLPASFVAPELCEHHPFKHGFVSQVLTYEDDPATLHVQCGDGVWVTADR